ncbi:PQQ-binding-like beta-propeller repeat protein [Streptomyces sp. ATE26]|uniref:outer membrane protein assembly factor BamB family protein n=1 Tax=Streptomyces sp. ATE26 TaxID=2954237 RepID=UPI0024824475|nr:PQQ-binding-like beta-propeller repeat protein [Streptomyces sp. ATE26]MDI1454252.1 PQQ-binding-like beta-propeller repeat protein [Streptomyces sp. ATE26]
MTERIIAGRYQLNRLLGRGGMGEVWAAHDAVIQRNVAVKVLHPSGSTEGNDLFLREARTAGGLNHPGVVTIYDVGQDSDGTFYLVMELLQGRDLSAVLRYEGPPALTDAIDWAAQTADALAAAHAARIVHRDLKPANLMLTPAGTIKILDFGIARFTSTVTQASRIIGTPHYMPPERLLGKAGDGRADLYSLGCLLHELLTGSIPFSDLDTVALIYAHLHRVPEPPSARSPYVPVSLDQLVLDLLAKDPENRPATAIQVRDRLRALPTAPLAESHPKPTTATKRTSEAAESVLAEPVGTTHHSAAREASANGPELTATFSEQPPPHSVHAPLPTRATSPHSLPLTAKTVRALPPTKRLLGATNPPWATNVSDDFLSSPVLADGSVYIASSGGRVFALDAATGTTRWTYITRGRVDCGSSPVVADGTVYIGSDHGLVYALDVATGTEQWTYATHDDRFSSPTVVGGAVYVGSDERKVYALDAATGTERWVQTMRGRVSSSPAVADGSVFFSSSDGRVYALNAITGTVRWIHRADAYESSSPAVADGSIYFSSGDGLFYALDASTGAERWTHPVDSASSSSPAIVDGTVYVGCLGDRLLYALDATTGAKQWVITSHDDSRTPEDDGDAIVYDDDVLSSPVVVKGIVYITSHDGKKLHALDAVTGDEQWAHASRDGLLNAPAVADGTVYITGEGGRVYSLDAATGIGATT